MHAEFLQYGELLDSVICGGCVRAVQGSERRDNLSPARGYPVDTMATRVHSRIQR